MLLKTVIGIALLALVVVLVGSLVWELAGSKRSKLRYKLLGQPLGKSPE